VNQGAGPFEGPSLFLLFSWPVGALRLVSAERLRAFAGASVQASAAGPTYRLYCIK
jgi:hypothetical protein